MALTNNQGLMIYCFEQIKINKDLTSRYVLFDGSLHIFKTKDALKSSTKVVQCAGLVQL